MPLRWIAVFLLATALMGCLEPPALRPRAPTPGVPYITVTSYNVNLDMSGDASTVAAVGASDADVICLQEVNAAWRDKLREAYGETYPFIAFTGETSGGLAVLSKHPFRDLGVTESFEGWHPAWHVLVDSPIGPLQLLLVHLRAPYTRREGLGGVFTAEDSHVTELSTVAEKCAADVPTVVLGDFNESTDGAAVRFLERRGFKNALPLFRPGEETWRYGRSLYGQTVDALDHILYENAALDPLNAYVRYVGRSDHFPVTVLLERRPDYN